MKKLYLIVVAFAAWATFAIPVVVVEKDAPVYENTAARELAKYLGKIALPKGSFDVANSAESPFIHVGKSPEALNVFGLQNWTCCTKCCTKTTTPRRNGSIKRKPRIRNDVLVTGFRISLQICKIRFLFRRVDLVTRPIGEHQRDFPAQASCVTQMKNFW